MFGRIFDDVQLPELPELTKWHMLL
jgi:hypothetical protein